MNDGWAVDQRARARAATLGLLAFAAVLLLLAIARSTPAELALPFLGLEGEATAERAYGELPLAFERDAGRSGPAVDFLAHTPARKLQPKGF